MVDALLVGSQDSPAAFDLAQASKAGDDEQTSRGKHAQGYTRVGAFHARQYRAGREPVLEGYTPAGGVDTRFTRRRLAWMRIDNRPATGTRFPATGLVTRDS